MNPEEKKEKKDEKKEGDTHGTATERYEAQQIQALNIQLHKFEAMRSTKFEEIKKKTIEWLTGEDTQLVAGADQSLEKAAKLNAIVMKKAWEDPSYVEIVTEISRVQDKYDKLTKREATLPATREDPGNGGVDEHSAAGRTPTETHAPTVIKEVPGSNGDGEGGR